MWVEPLSGDASAGGLTPGHADRREELMNQRAGQSPTEVGPNSTSEHELASAVLPMMPRTHHLLMLEFGNRKDFDDPRLEWRRLFSELLGTFMLVLVAAGGGILHGKGQISR